MKIESLISPKDFAEIIMLVYNKKITSIIARQLIKYICLRNIFIEQLNEKIV